MMAPASLFQWKGKFTNQSMQQLSLGEKNSLQFETVCEGILRAMVASFFSFCCDCML